MAQRWTPRNASKNCTFWLVPSCDLLEDRHIDDITINPLTPMSDQDRISPYNINMILSRQVMRIKKSIS